VIKFFRFLAQTIGAALVVIVEATIHYKIHPITAVNTPRDAIIVAFSFLPGVFIAYASIWLQQRITSDDEPEVPAAGALCSVMWFVYVFRALTLAIGLPGLSNWTEAPVNWTVRFFELFIH
jgi:hypothetical protein